MSYSNCSEILLFKKSSQHIYKGYIITLFLQISKLRPTEIEVSIKNIQPVNGTEPKSVKCQILLLFPLPHRLSLGSLADSFSDGIMSSYMSSLVTRSQAPI